MSKRGREADTVDKEEGIQLRERQGGGCSG